MTAYSIIKNPRGSGYLIDDGSGSSIRYPTKRAAELTIARWIEQEAREAAYVAERNAARLAEVNAYLAKRAARREIDARQSAFAF